MTDIEVVPAQRPKISRNLHRWGIAITALWLALIDVYIYLNFSVFSSLQPNSIADFVGGACAPLAFLWLVLGFFQQGEELRNSADALWLQGRELQNSVEQQRDLVEVTKKQLALESENLRAQNIDFARRAQPIIQVRPHTRTVESGGSVIQSFTVTNLGKQATDLHVDLDGQRLMERSYLRSDGFFTFDIDITGLSSKCIEAKVGYIDDRNLPGSRTFGIEIGADVSVTHIGTEIVTEPTF